MQLQVAVVCKLCVYGKWRMVNVVHGLMQREGRRRVWHPRLLHSSAAVRHCAHAGGAAPLLCHVQLLDDRPAHPVHILHLRLHR